MSRHYQCFIYDQRNVVISIYPVRKNAQRLETYAEIIFLIGLGSMTIMTLILSFELF